MEIPVYLFTGFLESGKTKYMQETLEDKRFNEGERTLLLVCEEGEEEYDPSTFASPNVFVEYVEDEAQLTEDALEAMLKKYRAKRVMIEYNGMWMLQTLIDALPDEWTLYQIFLFFDASTFMNYNANMRSLVVDKLQLCDLVVFNRFAESMAQMAYHKIVRALNRRVNIVYEYVDGHIVPDEIEDPLPFDLNAPVVEIEDRDYALWYKDLTEEPKKYIGKTVRYKAQAGHNASVGEGYFVVGRQMMTCCAADTQFAALIARNNCGYDARGRQWVTIQAKIEVQYHKAYGKRGPILLAEAVTPAQPPEQEVATFY